jgi:hypothetical protein
MDRHRLGIPHDIVEWQTAPSIPGSAYRTEARSAVVLFARLGGGGVQAALDLA